MVDEKQSQEAVIAATIKAVMQAMAPVLQSVALTPEKLAEMKKPYVDQAAVDREMHERAVTSARFKEDREKNEARMAGCRHKDEKNNYAISLIHNFPDRQVRGVCMHCGKVFQPSHWEIRPVAPKGHQCTSACNQIDGHAFIVPADKMYDIILDLDAAQGG